MHLDRPRADPNHRATRIETGYAPAATESGGNGLDLTNLQPRGGGPPIILFSNQSLTRGIWIASFLAWRRPHDKKSCSFRAVTASESCDCGHGGHARWTNVRRYVPQRKLTSN